MDVIVQKVDATQYSILTSLGNAGITFRVSHSGSMLIVLGFCRIFLYGSWIFGFALIFQYLINMWARKE